MTCERRSENNDKTDKIEKIIMTLKVHHFIKAEGEVMHDGERGGLDTTHKQHKTTHYTPHKRSGDHSPKELPPLLDLRRFEGGQVESALRIAGDCVSSVSSVLR